MLKVLHFVFAKNQNIIKIENDKLAKKGFAYLVHEPHKCA